MDLYIKVDNEYIKVVEDIIDELPGRWRYTSKGLNTARSMYVAHRTELPTGLWLSTEVPNVKTISMISKLSTVPSNPYDFTAIKGLRDELTNFLFNYYNGFGFPPRCGWPSTQDQSEAILDFLVKKAGITMVDKVPVQPERRLEPDL
jgi:hypothetical protein